MGTRPLLFDTLQQFSGGRNDMRRDPISASRIATALACAVGASCVVVASPQSSLDDGLRPITAYVAAYGDQASVIVASERYTQTAESDSLYATAGRGKLSRTLVSDFAIVKASIGWVGFRDVLSVDRKKIRDRDDRLVRLLTAAADGIENARRVSDESARYNIGFAVRNFNVPTMALFMFSPKHVSRFQFEEAKPSAGEVHLAFHETDAEGLIHREDGVAVPVSGEIWARADGTVTRTILRMSNFESAATDSSRAVIDVTYRLVPSMQMWLPESMAELYEDYAGPLRRRATGRAEYSNYRRFQTGVRIK